MCLEYQQCCFSCSPFNVPCYMAMALETFLWDSTYYLGFSYLVSSSQETQPLSPCIYPLKEQSKWSKNSSRKQSFVSNFAPRAHTRRQWVTVSLWATWGIWGHLCDPIPVCWMVGQEIYFLHRKSTNLLYKTLKCSMKNWIERVGNDVSDYPIKLCLHIPGPSLGKTGNRRQNNAFVAVTVCRELGGHEQAPRAAMILRWEPTWTPTRCAQQGLLIWF